MNPIDNAANYDIMVLDGILTPGLTALSGAALTRKWDERKGYGASGATDVYTGDEIVKFTATITFFDEPGGMDAGTMIEFYNLAIAPILVPAPDGKTPKAIPFFHAHVAFPPLEVTAVVVESIGQLTQNGDLWTVPIKFRQHRPAKASVGKPAGAGTGPGGNTSQDEIDQTIGDLTKQLKGLAA